jgi:hypothetical protein
MEEGWWSDSTVPSRRILPVLRKWTLTLWDSKEKATLEREGEEPWEELRDTGLIECLT